MSSALGLPITPIIYIDTNAILAAKEYDQRGAAIGDSSFRTRGRNCGELLNECFTKGFRVATLKFTLAEMLSIYQRWHYADTKIREGVPYDEVLGNSRHELERKFYTPANLAPVAARIDAWLTSWRFKGLVELYPLNDPQGFSAWSFMFWEITRIIFKHTFISAPDCLHAAAALVLGADLFVSNDGGLKTALRQLYDSTALKAEAASVLGILPADITLPHGALKVRDALEWAKRQ